MESIHDSTRPLDFWITAVARLRGAELAAAFEAEGASLHEWRLLSRIDDDEHPAFLPALHHFAERGWATESEGVWTLTDAGREIKERLDGIAAGVDERIARALSSEELATAGDALEKIAVALGWEEGKPLPRGPRHGHGFDARGFDGHRFGGRRGFAPDRRFGRSDFEDGSDFGPGFGPHAGFDPRRGFGPHAGFGPHRFPREGFDPEGAYGFGPGSDPRGSVEGDRPSRNHEHRGHGPARFARFAQHAYERGFDAGFRRGHEA